MKSLQQVLSQNISEARNYPYTVEFNIKGKIIKANLSLEDPRDASLFDSWLEDEIDNDIYHAEGGPNDIEL